MIEDFGIIVQARMGSSRLPNKMGALFFNNSTILEIIFQKLLKVFNPSQIVLATSIDPKNTTLIEKAQKYKLSYFVGSENDVLDRFLMASNRFGFKKVIRICADNPFIQENLVKELFLKFENSEADYCSWFINKKKPSILTHCGFFAEAINVSALQTVKKLTNNAWYFEHVTNFIYENSDKFTIEWIPFDDEALDNIRLTIDTKEDFEIAQSLYKNCYPNLDIKNIKDYLQKNEEILNSMKGNISKNEK